MGLSEKIFNNTGKPTGFLGKIMVMTMNNGHASLSKWGRGKLSKNGNFLQIADLGCGGGRNAKELLKIYEGAHVTALDYSEVSVEKTKKVNKEALEKGQLNVVQGDVSALPFEKESFDLVTAMETVYFWPGPEKSFKEVYRTLKPGGKFLIVNESDGTNKKDEKWVQMIDNMKIYTEEEMIRHLKNAGFEQCTIFHKKEKYWIAFLAKKN